MKPREPGNISARAWELPDRGLVRTGYAADLVVFDEQQIKPRLPTVEQDLPDGTRRLVKSDAISAAVVGARSLSKMVMGPVPSPGKY